MNDLGDVAKWYWEIAFRSTILSVNAFKVEVREHSLVPVGSMAFVFGKEN